MKKIISLILSACMLASSLAFCTNAFAASKPDSPYTVTLIKESETSVKIYWHHIKNAKGYKIYRSVEKSKGYKLVKTTKAFSFVDSGLSSSVKYYYKVRSYKNSKGKKVYSSYTKPESIVLQNVAVGALNDTFESLYDTGEMTYDFWFDADDITYDETSNIYTIKGKVYDSVIISKSKAESLKKGDKFTVKYKSSENTVRTEKYKVEQASHIRKNGIYIKGISGKSYNTKTKKSKKSSPWAYTIYPKKGSKDYILTSAQGISDFNTAMDVTIYIDGNWKFGSTPGAEDKDKVTFAEFMESGNITEKDNYIWATTENGTLTSYGFMV